MLSAEVTVEDMGRRSEFRLPTDIRARYGTAGKPARALCRIVDMSRSGARLEVYCDLPPRTLITLTLPGRDTVRTIRARIVWSTDFEAGCFFLDPLDKGELEQIFRKGHA